ncbi:MAG: VOC family protein [Gammaproteobacteria bacterium]|jgi:predicted enzyme related to lactoylglutathione lyase
MSNQIVWVDIPVDDLDRAIKFYAAVLDAEVTKQAYPGFALGLLPNAGSGVSGCLFKSQDNRPSRQGPLIYLNVNGRLDAAVTAAGANGGTVLQGKHQIGEYGFRAMVLDSEGNRIALHSVSS